LTIREATVADAPRGAELSGVLGYPVEPAVIGQRLVRLLDRREEVVLIAEIPSGEIVGWVHGAEQELLETGRRCEIQGLVVAAEHRGRGVGRRLVSDLEAWAQGRGLTRMTVRSNAAREESHPFYERLGYALVKTQHVYRRQLGDAGSLGSGGGADGDDR
jgi:GNAT superfamily N-acetyltransferase